MERESIIGLGRVSIKEAGFITKSVELDLFSGRMEISMRVNSFMIKCTVKEDTTRTVESYTREIGRREGNRVLLSKLLLLEK